MSVADEFTALDWIGVGLNALMACALLAFPVAVAPSFASMFADFAAKSALPAITQVAMMPWPGPALAVMVATPTVVGAVMRTPEKTALRRGLVVVAFFVGAIGVAVLMYAMYAPILDLAGKIKDE